MFGVLYGLFTLACKGIGKFQQSLWDEQNRERAKQDGQDTYYGKNGERLVSNGRSVWRKRDANGDDVLADLYTGEVYRNYSQEKREAAVREALGNGETVLRATAKEDDVPENYNKYHKAFIQLGYYKDIKTGRLFTRVAINGIGFYMDSKGRLVRVEDNQKFRHNAWSKYNITPEEIISIVNKRQEELYPLINYKDFMWLKNYFYLASSSYYFIKDDKKLYKQYGVTGKERDISADIVKDID